MFQKIINGYTIRKSTRAGKKYDVFKNGRKVTSFGDKNYQHYNDRIGGYAGRNHMDAKRRQNYRSRHKHDKINNPNYAGYWAYHYLW